MPEIKTSTQQPMAEFVVAGHICLDIIPTFGSHDTRNLFVPGKMVSVGKAILATGGSVANTGAALYRLGSRTRLMGKVGADKFGETILESLQALDPALVEEMILGVGEDTSYSIVIDPPGKDRSFLHNPGANDTYRPDDIRLGALKGARYFHFGYPPVMRAVYQDGGTAMAELMRQVKQLGLTTSLDMAYPDPDSEAGRLDWRSWLECVLPQVDIFLPSFDEILFMLDRPLFERMSAAGKLVCSRALLARLSDELLDMGTAVAVLKLGDQGLYMKSTGILDRLKKMGSGKPHDLGTWLGVEFHMPCFQCDEVGATGSGDCTIAGYLVGISKGLAPEDVMTMAVGVGGFNVESADATSGIPHWDVVRQRVNRGWQKHPTLIE